MNSALKRLLGVGAAVATGATALLGTGAGTAEAAGRAHCDRAERPIWSEGPSRNVTARHCDLPDQDQDQDHRWYTVEFDTLVQPHHENDYVDGGVERTATRNCATWDGSGTATTATGPAQAVASTAPNTAHGARLRHSSG
ncbi:hypothetical protein, partial [Streptomyces sp. WELS2]|uniref:hypothetical protein n=1 Tax=Streptomyces sp. WELS2 TaxID=2749435 RepID=UPI0015F05228